MPRFMLKKDAMARGAEWLNRETVYEGELMSIASRLVRLFAPFPTERLQHVDVPLESVTLVR